MEISEKGLKLLAQWEGDILHVYNDQAGLPTIGIGHLLTKQEIMSGLVKIGEVTIRLQDGITYDQSLALLHQDVKPFEDEVSSLVKVPLDQDQFDALVIFSFNIGAGGFESSTVLRDVNAGNFDQVPNAMLMWTKITDPRTHQHVTSDGLIARRDKEISLFEGKIA